MTTRSALALRAIAKSLEIREEAGFDFKSPLCVYDLCDTLGISVRFVDYIDMEGVYVAFNQPIIILSSLRPQHRRVFNCAHELGHHVFHHGSTIDDLRENIESASFDLKEFLADAFAGMLLIPKLGVSRAFITRGWDPLTATPEQIFTVACAFGVGYETMVSHLAYGLKMISHERAVTLRRTKLQAIRSSLVGKMTKDPLVIADLHYEMATIDTEVGTLLLVPSKSIAESNELGLITDIPTGRLFKAIKPGLVRMRVPHSSWAVIARISRHQYAGISRYRHLEEAEGE